MAGRLLLLLNVCLVNIEWPTIETRVDYNVKQYNWFHVYSVVLQELWSVIDWSPDYKHFVGALHSASVSVGFSNPDVCCLLLQHLSTYGSSGSC